MYTDDVAHLRRLKNAGFNPGVVFDVGVSNGEFFYACQQVFQDAKYYLFEARKKRETRIMETVANVDVKYKLFFDLLLGNFEKDITFHQIDAGSSIYPEKTKLPRVEIVKKMRIFSQFLDEKKLRQLFKKSPERNFLKIDTQGAELKILTGLAEYIAYFEVIQLEVALLEYNEGAPTVAQVMKFMTERDFALYDIGPSFRRQSDEAMFHVDFVFVAKRSPLRDDKIFWAGEDDVAVQELYRKNLAEQGGGVVD